VIPAKTEIFVTLQRNVNTKSAYLGERFYGQVSVPVTMNDTIIIPVGSTIWARGEERRPGLVKGRRRSRSSSIGSSCPKGLRARFRRSSNRGKLPDGSNRQDRGDNRGGTDQGGDVIKGAAEGGVYGTSTESS